VNTTITKDSFTADYRCVPTVREQGAPAFTRARFVVEDGVRGMRQVYDNPSSARSSLAPRSDAQKIRDTLEAESR
jgi:alkaline phosphatase D